MSPATKPKKRFPKKELNSWLRGRTEWNHGDWLGLLSSLKDQGFGEWTECPERRDEIGSYLESKRPS